MNVDLGDMDGAAARIAAAIGEPARARMLYTLMDDRARTSTELALIADVSPSTASAHLSRLKAQGLVEVRAQGKHRYYRLAGSAVAAALEKLSVLAGDSRGPFKPTAPIRLRAARTCYDHLAGSLGVALHDRFIALGWLTSATPEGPDVYDLTPAGVAAFEALGIDIESVRALRRRFAFGCLDWSERRAHLGGGLGAALLRIAFDKKWVVRERDSRALRVTDLGCHQMLVRLGIEVHSGPGMRV